MNLLSALLMGVIGVSAIGYAIKSVLAGVINLSNKSRGEYPVTFADEPVLFVFGVIFLLVLGGASCLMAWRQLAGTGDDQ
ncbi:MAG: hypothetical protein SF172_16175 [Burkholderiales bacterium]|nr:hypothetical protein [Burkholderiales bacterium]